MTRRTILGAAAAMAATPGHGAAKVGPAPSGVPLPGARLKPDFEALVPVPGGRAWVRVNGDLRGRKPPIVLIHGGPGSSHWSFLNATAMADDRAGGGVEQDHGILDWAARSASAKREGRIRIVRTAPVIRNY